MSGFDVLSARHEGPLGGLGSPDDLQDLAGFRRPPVGRIPAQLGPKPA